MLPVGQSAFAAARAPHPPPKLPPAQIAERNLDIANGIPLSNQELGDSSDPRFGPIPVPVPSTNNLNLSTWWPESDQISTGAKVEGSVTIFLPPLVEASFVGVYILHVVKGKCWINGALMTDKSRPRTIYAPANHALPHIKSPPFGPCIIALQSWNDSIKALGQVSSLFRGLWNSDTAIARQPGFEGLSQRSFQFVSLVNTAKMPSADET
jgi:hypothetical protein